MQVEHERVARVAQADHGGQRIGGVAFAPARGDVQMVHILGAEHLQEAQPIGQLAFRIGDVQLHAGDVAHEFFQLCIGDVGIQRERLANARGVVAVKQIAGFTVQAYHHLALLGQLMHLFSTGNKRKAAVVLEL